jgi:thioredoxin-dependent peroxiredoxin
MALIGKRSEPEVGAPAPDFTLQASDGKMYSLSDFKGKKAVVIAWFPKAFTRGCTIECKSLAEKGHLIRKFNVAYFMASTDPIDDNTGFAVKEHADFPILSDPKKEVARKYGVLGLVGFASRWTYYIGKDGTLLEIDKSIKPATSAEDIAAKLQRHGIETV